MFINEVITARLLYIKIWTFIQKKTIIDLNSTLYFFIQTHPFIKSIVTT